MGVCQLCSRNTSADGSRDFLDLTRPASTRQEIRNPKQTQNPKLKKNLRCRQKHSHGPPAASHHSACSGMLPSSLPPFLRSSLPPFLRPPFLPSSVLPSYLCRNVSEGSIPARKVSRKRVNPDATRSSILRIRTLMLAVANSSGMAMVSPIAVVIKAKLISPAS